MKTIDREQLLDLIYEHLGCTYVCTRVWEAWSYGTMRQGDFIDARDTELADELADAILAKLK